MCFQDYFAVKIHHEIIGRTIEEFLGVIDVMLVHRQCVRDKDGKCISCAASRPSRLLPLGDRESDMGLDTH